jgi:hypothetical protein
MEQFRLRVRHEPRRGNLWELQLVPESPRTRRAAASRLLGSASAPEGVRWLADLLLALAPSAEASALVDRGAKAEPLRLEHDAGMRVALAFSAARYLGGARQRQLFATGVVELPGEVLLYWFTICFYGHRLAAGRAALRTLLTYEEPISSDGLHNSEGQSDRKAKHRREQAEPDLFSLASEGRL